jgi:hypothetical protein
MQWFMPVILLRRLALGGSQFEASLDKIFMRSSSQSIAGEGGTHLSSQDMLEAEIGSIIVLGQTRQKNCESPCQPMTGLACHLSDLGSIYRRILVQISLGKK